MGTVNINISRAAQAAMNGDLAAAKSHAKEMIKEAWKREVDEIGMPVEGSDFAVNFRPEDSAILENALAPDTSPSVQIRAMDNKMHSMPREDALLVPNLQRAYYTEMLYKKWFKQEEIDAKESIPEVRSVRWR
jgi:hypothetical protein